MALAASGHLAYDGLCFVTLTLNPSAQRCLPKFFIADFNF
jgi:hypothetical protein